MKWQESFKENIWIGITNRYVEMEHRDYILTLYVENFRKFFNKK